LRELNHRADTFSPLADLLERTPERVSEGVLDFVTAAGDDYCENFGAQWNRYREVQLDSSSSSSASRDRFFAETGWTADEIKGKVLLDAGCGAGRFAEVALDCGAKVVAVDLSAAAWACRRTLERFCSDDYLVLRADLFDLPLRAQSFDGIYSLGVLQHTPDPLGAVDQLARFLKPTARLATWIYEKRAPDLSWLQPRTWFRAAIARQSGERKLVFSRSITAMFFPLGWTLSWFGRSGERASQFLPYAARHHLARGDFRLQWHYCVMDTFDWYGPVYERPQRELDLMNKMKDVGLTNVQRRAARGMAVTGDAPIVSKVIASRPGYQSSSALK
jgi:SAM-dependent methyltransferase